MKLTAWLKQQHPMGERLQVVERMAQALNEQHDRGEPLAALDPERMNVNDGECDISAARRGNPSAGYSAPERAAEGGAASIEADIYAAGAIAWEILAGRPYAASPSHLAEAAPEVPRELADAVMACLEQSPQWRPRDLTYLAQLAAHAQGQRPQKERASRPAATPRSAPSRAAGRSAAPLRTLGQRESRSHLPLAAAAALVVVAAGAGYYWLTRESSARTPIAAPTTAPTALQVTAQASSAAPAVTTLPPVTLAAHTPAPDPASHPTMSPALPTPTASAAAVAPTPLPRPTPTMPPVRVATSELPRGAATPVPAPASTPAPTAAPGTLAPPPSLVRETPVLSAVSPLSVRRPGKVVLDLRGSGLRPDLRARILPLKEMPRGITIARQVCKNEGLLQVLLDLDATVAPGVYGIAIEDPSGARTPPLTFTVTK